MSTLRLILTRHAKSSWDDPTLADHDRPLNARGIRAAGLIGGWLASRGDVPGEVLRRLQRAGFTAQREGDGVLAVKR